MTEHRHRILLVDDDPGFLQAVRRWLVREFEVETSESALDALERMREQHFDCVVADLRMPEMDGAELLIRAAELRPRTGRIAMSAYNDLEAVVRAINRGAVMGFLIKPFTFHDITSAVYRAIARAGASRASASVLAILESEADGRSLTGWLAGAGIGLRLCSGIDEVASQLARASWDAILIDLDLPTALDLLRLVSASHAGTYALLLGDERSLVLSEDLARLGARDMVTKPLREAELLLRLHLLLVEKRAKETAASPVEGGNLRLIGESEVMAALRRMVQTVASVECAVLVRGETGTGKELVASTLHRQGPRADGPFLAVNCAALAETLFESEVFGHERGAFTGAVQQKRGLCELAADGSLLLDEVGELSPGIQAKLLRFLETGEFFRVGGTTALHSNARILAATNRDLGGMIEAGGFRADLYHRLSTIEIFVPPLREHVEDIPQLVSHFLGELARRHARPAISIDPDAMEELIQYRWPGNVRELQSVLERGVLLSVDGRVRQGLLPRGAQGSTVTVDISLPLKDAVAEATRRAEHEYLVRLLALCEGNVAEAARRAGIDRRNLYRKLELLRIDPTSFR